LFVSFCVYVGITDEGVKYLAKVQDILSKITFEGDEDLQRTYIKFKLLSSIRDNLYKKSIIIFCSFLFVFM
jgi:hypothetical protein